MREPSRPQPPSAPEVEGEIRDLASPKPPDGEVADESAIKGGALRAPSPPSGPVPLPYPNAY